MSTRRSVTRAGIIAMLALFCLSTDAFARDAAGKVTFLRGDAWVQQGIAKNPLQSGSIVYSGDKIRTGEDSLIRMKFLDRTSFSLGPEAKMNLDVYSEAEDTSENFGISLLKGAFRFVSGLLAKQKPKKYNVRVSVGTIGVRGTAVAGEVFERRETEDGVIEASARVMLLEDEDNPDSAIEVSNQFGSVVIDKPGFGTEIPDEHSPPSPVRRMQLRTINNLLRAIRNSTRSTTQRRKLPN